jgi:hypothetical protein
MTANLHEFLAMVGLVTGATTFVVGFRYTIIMLDRRMTEHIKSRQPMIEAIKARVEETNK